MTRRAAGAAARTATATLVALKPSDLAALQSNATRACALLKALSNEVRLMLVCQLSEGEKSVGELQDFVKLSQSAVSQQLAQLELAHKCQLITRQKRPIELTAAGQVFYKPETAPKAAAFNAFLEFAQWPVWRITPLADPEGASKVELSDLRFGAPGSGHFSVAAVLDSAGRTLKLEVPR